MPILEVFVPERVIGSIYGENGSDFAHIQQISGEKVIMNDPRPGAAESLVIISGTPEQTHAAQNLVHYEWVVLTMIAFNS